jgi:signal transduction histidine kinase
MTPHEAVEPAPGALHQQAQIALLSRLAGTLSHEIRNPLNAIFLHTDILEEELRQPAAGDRAQMEQSLATIKAEVTRLHDLMQDYLALARLSDLQREPENIAALLEDLILEMQGHAVARQVMFRCEGLDDVGVMTVHQSLLRRALLNLLLGMLDTLPAGGTLTMRGQRTTAHLGLDIDSTGHPMPADEWSRWHTAIQALEPDDVDLRIYVAREIVAAHGGKLTVSCPPGAGLTCTMTLPLDPAALES